MKTFFNIALSGLSEADAKTVLLALESPELEKWSLSEGGNSDLMVVDVDSVWGHMDWLRAIAEGRRCAAYTDQESVRDADLILRKPLDRGKLIGMLLQVQSGAPAKTKAAPAKPVANKSAPAKAPQKEAATPNATRPAPAPAPVLAPKPDAKPQAVKPAAQPAPTKTTAAPSNSNPAVAPSEDTPATVGDLLLSGSIKTPTLIQGSDGVTQLFIDPGKNIYRAPPQLKPLQQLMEMPMSAMRSVESDAKVQHAGPEQPIVRLLWFAALCASDGALAPHLEGSSVWKLTRWPQIEREFPRHFRIATAMMKQAGTLEEVAAAAKSPTEDVAGFINAYYVAGYVAAEGSDEPVDAANSTDNVLSRLRRSFSRSVRPATS